MVALEEHVNDIDDEEPESEPEPEEFPLSKPAKNHVHNREGLLEKLDDIAWPENVDWVHKLAIDHDQEQDIDVNDDLVRESAFYTQALNGARQAFEKLQSMGIPFLRPPDYYAEMVKSDSHMLKVKSKLLEEKKHIEEAEERRKAREAKRIAKEVQAQKTKEKAKKKKEEIESVKKWRKQRQQSGFAKGAGDELGLGLDDGQGLDKSKKRRPGVAPGDRSGGFKRQKNNKRRESKNSKFGHGGRKGMRKQNTTETTNDLKGFNGGDSSGNNKRRKK